MAQAGVYSSALHYLRAAADGGGAGPGRRGGQGRAHEGDADRRRLLRPRLDPHRRPQAAPVLSVGGEEAVESKGPWDYYKLPATTPADEAFRPLSASTCPLAKA